MPGYRQKPNVSPTSDVETFVAMRIEIDNWRFAGVPIYVRAGKASRIVRPVAPRLSSPPPRG